MSNDLETKNDNDLAVSHATKGVASCVIGASALALSAISGALIPGVVLGGALSLISGGLISKSNDKQDKLLGKIGLGVGVLTVAKALSLPIISGLSGLALFGGGLGLIAVSGYHGYNFYKKINKNKHA